METLFTFSILGISIFLGFAMGFPAFLFMMGFGILIQTLQKIGSK